VFTQCNGWAALQDCLTDSDITVRRKTAFLLASLLISGTGTAPTSDFPNDLPLDAASLDTSTPTRDQLQSGNSTLLTTIINELANPTPYGVTGEELEPDAEFEEMLVKCLANYVSVGGVFKDEEQDVLREVWKGWVAKSRGTFGLDAGEWRALTEKILH